MRRCLFAAVFALCFSVEDFYAQAPDSCLYIQPDSMAADWQHTNPDSVAVDTCSSSPTYRKWYSKRYDAYFKVNAFHLGYGEPDSVMIVYWEDIDTIYTALRDSFESIYNNWGSFYFRKVRPEDTSHAFEHFKIIFDEYLLADNGVFDDLRKIMTDGLVEIGLEGPDIPPLEKVSKVKKSVVTWKVYRNKLIIDLPKTYNEKVLEIRIYDLLGKRLHDSFKLESSISNQYEGSVHNFSRGAYFGYIEQFHSSILFIVQ